MNSSFHIGWVGWLWIFYTASVLIVIVQLRSVLALKAQILVIRCDIVRLRLKRRYLLIKRAVVHKWGGQTGSK